MILTLFVDLLQDCLSSNCSEAACVLVLHVPLGKGLCDVSLWFVPSSRVIISTHQALFPRPIRCSALAALNTWLRKYFTKPCRRRPVQLSPWSLPHSQPLQAQRWVLAPAPVPTTWPLAGSRLWTPPTTIPTGTTPPRGSGPGRGQVLASARQLWSLLQTACRQGGVRPPTRPAGACITSILAQVTALSSVGPMLCSTALRGDLCNLVQLNMSHMQLRSSCCFAVKRLSSAGQTWVLLH